MKNNKLTLFLELLIIPIIALPVVVWGSRLNWDPDFIGSVTVFPLLGLVAFSIMWWHFLLGFVSNLNPSFTKMKNLHRTSSYFVLLLILLHPLLLAFYSVSNSLGGPPDAYYNFVSPSKAVFITYGILALTVFILYDVARWLRNSQGWIGRNWQIVDAIDDVAFVAIFFHGLYLGQDLQSGWFRYVWLFYGISALLFITYKHYRAVSRSHENEKD